MNIPVFIAEAAILCLLFTAVIMLQSRKPLEAVYNMPKPIIDRCIELGLVNESQKATSPETRRKKLFSFLLIALILATVIYFINGVKSFLTALLICYGLWLVVDWFDCFVIDWGWVCHSKKIIIPGTEDLTASYKPSPLIDRSDIYFDRSFRKHRLSELFGL